LLVGQPTRGVDIGAIEFIHRRLIELRDAGKAILLVSVELDEVLSLSDRVIVMFDGKIVGERVTSKTNEKEIGLLMAGVTENLEISKWGNSNFERRSGFRSVGCCRGLHW
ncbi:MAG: hypothetical protein ACKVLN_09805, partial [Rhodobacterales bacterium]